MNESIISYYDSSKLFFYTLYLQYNILKTYRTEYFLLDKCKLSCISLSIYYELWRNLVKSINYW